MQIMEVSVATPITEKDVSKTRCEEILKATYYINLGIKTGKGNDV